MGEIHATEPRMPGVTIAIAVAGVSFLGLVPATVLRIIRVC